MTLSKARSILVKFSSKKKLTSNGSKPIRVLTRTKISRSDLRKPNAYSLPTFQPHRSNFFGSLTTTADAANQEGRGSTRWEGSAHPNPPGGDRANTTLTQTKAQIQICKRTEVTRTHAKFYMLSKNQREWTVDLNSSQMLNQRFCYIFDQQKSYIMLEKRWGVIH